jgi:predicted dienelactone hydrolase
VGIRRNIAFVDESRAGRKVTLTIWYPAEKPSDYTGPAEMPDAKPDASAAPYPLIISSTKAGFMFAPLIVTHGFVYIGINGIDVYQQFGKESIDQPLDYVFALDQIAKTPPAELEGLMDTEKVGAMGYSFDGTNALLLSGARVDPAFYLNWCQQAALQKPPYESWYLSYYCATPEDWKGVEEAIGADITKGGDGLWHSITDPRIKAVMPMAPDGAWLLGEKGLSYADKAVLMIQAGLDSPYQPAEGKFVFEHLGSPEKSMVTFLGREHMMIYATDQVKRMAQLAIAFFGVQLQGKAELAQYYSEAYLAGFTDLAWGFQNK